MVDSERNERFRYFIREIGQGPKATRDLTHEEAQEAMGMILDGEATAAQMGAFLLLQRFKGEAPSELSGFIQAIRDRAHLIFPKVAGLVDIGSPYDGRVTNIVMSPAAAITVAACGVPVVMHGEKGMPPKRGIAVGDVLADLGVEVDAAPERVQDSIEDTGFGYMRQARFVPALYALKGLRYEIALRSSISTVEKLYDLAGAPFHIIGLTHLPYLEKLLDAIEGLGFKRTLIVQGIEGNEDAPTARPCRIFEFWGGSRNEYRLDPKEFGLQPATREDMALQDAHQCAEISLQVLTGGDGPYRDLVALNAGLRLYLAERAPNIGDGIEMARRAIDSGAAAKKLQELRSYAVPAA